MILLVFFFCLFFDASSSVAATAAASTFILRLFRTYLALYLIQSDTKDTRNQVIFARVCRTFIVPLPASILSVSSYDTDVFYHCQQNESPISLSFTKYDF